MANTLPPAIENHQVIPFQKPRKRQVAPSEASSQKSRLIRKKEVKERIGIKADSSLYKMIADKKFPAPIHINGGRSSFWLESSIDDFINSLLPDAENEAA